MSTHSNTGIAVNPSAPKYTKGARFNWKNVKEIVLAIEKGVHPEVAAAAQGWLPEEFQELLGRNEKLRRLLIKHYARYEIKRSAQVDASTDSKTALAYLERCRTRWSKKVDVSLAPLAKKALDRLEKDLKAKPMLSGEEAWEMLLDAFASEQAQSLIG